MHIQWEKSTYKSTLVQIMEEKTSLPASELISPTHKSLFGMEELALEFLSMEGNIAIISDYDADGITSSVELALIMDELKKQYSVYVPRRFSEGYGISREVVSRISPAENIITVDNGIKAKALLDEFKADGKKVYIIDHHLADEDSETLPNANMIIDPEVFENDDFKHLCAAGLVCELAEALYNMKQISKLTMDKIYMLAAIGTIADVMPLVYNNRYIVKKGLEILNQKKWSIISELELTNITATDVAFKIAPLINAAGRLLDDGGEYAYNLLYKSLTSPKKDQFASLIELNNERKSLQDFYYKAILEVYNKEKNHTNPVMLYVPDCPEGIIGILAGKLCEKLNVSTIIFTDSDAGILKGSARSNGKLNMKEFLDKHKKFFIKYGGHVGAGGMSMKIDNFLKLKELCKTEKIEDKNIKYFYDFTISETMIKDALEQFDAFEPYGEGCEKPIVHIMELHLVLKFGSTYKMLKNNTILKLNCNGYSAIIFNEEVVAKYKKMNYPCVLEAIGKLNRNYYNGKEEIQFEIIDIKEVEQKPADNRLLRLIREKALESEKEENL